MLNIDLKGKRVFIAGVADDGGYGWAIAKACAEAGAEIILGTWTPLVKLLEQQLRTGRLDESRTLSDGSMLEFAKIYPLDAAYDSMEDVPEEVRESKRFKAYSDYCVADVAKAIEKDFGQIDFLVHSLANGPEVKKPLLETSRSGYLAAVSASSYSFISLLQHMGPLLREGGATVSLTYAASEAAIPGYGGGMSSAKAALESDTRTLAFEAGRKWGVRVNTISAGPFRSRAAKAIGGKGGGNFIDQMIDYAKANAPLQRDLLAEDIGNSAAFLLSPLASAITGMTLYADNGLQAMGVGTDSPTLAISEEAACTAKTH